MKRVLQVIAALLLLAFIVIQFFRIDRTNPPVVDSETLDATVAVPDNVRMILETSCNDCHSNKTRYPWYSTVAPMSWFLKSHIDEGRQHLNFSVFKTYTANRQVQKFDQICDELESKEMPLPSYLWIHRDAVLTDEQSKMLCDWARDAQGKINKE